MKIDIPKVITAVPLSEYAPELSGQYLHIWVNPSKQKLQEHQDRVTRLQVKELAAAKATLFPQKQQETERTPLQKAFEQLAHWLKVKQERPAEHVDESLLGWYAEIWSQGPEDARWTVDELVQLETRDPAFLSWMIARTWEARAEHIERKKKA